MNCFHFNFHQEFKYLQLWFWILIDAPFFSTHTCLCCLHLSFKESDDRSADVCIQTSLNSDLRTFRAQRTVESTTSCCVTFNRNYASDAFFFFTHLKGDVSETVRMFFEESKSFPPASKSLLTIQEVDESLTRLAQLTKEDEQQSELEAIAKK